MPLCYCVYSFYADFAVNGYKRVDFIFRYAYTSDAATRYSTYVGQCLVTVFFCFLHLWHHRSTALGRAAASTVLLRPSREHLIWPVSTKSFRIISCSITSGE